MSRSGKPQRLGRGWLRSIEETTQAMAMRAFCEVNKGKGRKSAPDKKKNQHPENVVRAVVHAENIG